MSLLRRNLNGHEDRFVTPMIPRQKNGGSPLKGFFYNAMILKKIMVAEEGLEPPTQGL